MERYFPLMATRRQFLSAALALPSKAEKQVAGSFVNDSYASGHQLRDRTMRIAPTRTVKMPIVIVGGGVAGLSAAWWLDKRGFHDFVLLEMEKQAGGNSRWGENDITAYPWAAHYVPVPNSGATLVRELMTELGVLSDGKWNERYLCFSPQERLFIHGRWQEGIEPDSGISPKDREDFQRFNEIIAALRDSKQFTIPMEPGAKASILDKVSMREWLHSHKLVSPYLHWYVDYACRDDFGSHSSDTSAWAGVHYFAAREHEDKGPLTWPEGNGWIVRRLLTKLSRYVRTGTIVSRIERRSREVRVTAGDTEYIASAVVFAAPTFLARYLCTEAPPLPLQYSPWITANLTLDRPPAEKRSEPAWENVIYGSASLGYVVATHMSLRTHIDRTVWTWYHALASAPPAESRRLLLEKDWSYWKDFILDDLSRAHPDIRECVSRIDIMRIGHAMARPVPGSIFSDARLRLVRSSGNVIFANSDVSAFSIFEEAQYRGVKAAERALKMA
jgi:glycine/D-amino acid oxidase-like deaminating enzyme